MGHFSISLTFIISFAVTFIATPVFSWLAVRLGIYDLPNKRKIHKKATPLLGGLAIYLGVICGVLLHLQRFNFFLPLLFGGTLILIVGLIDDVKGLNVQLRLFFQLISALIIIFSGHRISFLPNNPWCDIAEIIVTLIWIVGVTNAYNYLDGMDGLLTGSVIINSLFFAIILFNTGQNFLVLLCLILVASGLGFLPYNLKDARIFLGDAGSTFLGFTLAGIALIGNWAPDNIVKISIPILILGVPIFDMIFTTIMRIKEEKIRTLLEWLKYGGKDHFHHYLVDLGLTHFGAVVFIYFTTISLGISAIMVSNDRAIEAFLALAQASIIFGIIAALIVIGKRRHYNSASKTD